MVTLILRKSRLRFGLLVISASIGTAACAGVRVYSDAALKNETGIKTFGPKPFLLVTRTGAKDKPVELSVIYLPDTSDVLYVRQKGGWGSNELSVKLSNGILTEFGTKSDSKIPETLTSLGSILTAAAGAYKTVQEGAQIRDEAASRADLDIAAAALRNVAAELVQTVDDLTSTTANQRSEARAIQAALSAVADVLADPSALARVGDQAPVLDALGKRIVALKMPAPAPTDVVTAQYNARIDTFAAETGRVADLLRPPTADAPTFELYEILQRDGRVRLVRVEIGG